MKCPFCSSDNASKSGITYTWTFSDGRKMELTAFRCGSCRVYYVTNPENGVFVAVEP